MLRLLCLAAVVLAGVFGQMPAPCVTPPQLTLRAFQVDHGEDVVNRFYIVYDSIYKRKVIYEEQNVIMPGKQYHEYLILNNANVQFDINLKTKECTKSTPLPFRPFGIPPNATFENEYTIGGPDEQVSAQEWSDRIPFRQREYWIGSFSLKNCYPIHELIIANEQVNSSVSANFYDIVVGIVDPSVFIPPTECLTAKAAPSKMKYYW